MKKFKCLKCGHEWLPRVEGVPKQCPKCKSYGYSKGPKKTKGGGKSVD